MSAPDGKANPAGSCGATTAPRTRDAFWAVRAARCQLYTARRRIRYSYPGVCVRERGEGIALEEQEQLVEQSCLDANQTIVLCICSAENVLARREAPKYARLKGCLPDRGSKSTFPGVRD